MTDGALVRSRGGVARELAPHVIPIEQPLERVLVLAGRRNNVFASLAETLWMIAGRDDLNYLIYYLPRARDFSDDGKTWRGAYGPRLRSWSGVDQLAEVVRLLNGDNSTRRAIMTLFDPAKDFVESKDIPCNNWLHFLIRDDKLHLTIAVRSNDAIWGFSGVNAFEWSVLQQMMAHWTGTAVGTMTFFVSSFHLYERHFDRATEILSSARVPNLYDHGMTAPRFSVAMEDLDAEMKNVFALEMSIRGGEKGIDARLRDVADDFLRTSLQLLRVYSLYKDGASGDVLAESLDNVPLCDLRVGAIDYLTRQRRLRDRSWLRLRPAEQAFFDAYWSRPRCIAMDEVLGMLRRLHDKKSRIYGDSWKRHGELLSVFANISRKYDRLAAVADGAPVTADEGLLDTLADLSIYAGKYMTFIADRHVDVFEEFLRENGISGRVSEFQGNEGYGAITTLLASRHRQGSAKNGSDSAPDIGQLHHAYAVLEKTVIGEQAREDSRAKLVAASEVSLASARAVVGLAALEPAAFAAFAERVDCL